MSTNMVKAEAPIQVDALPVFESVAYQTPKVNLLPPEIGERRKLRKLQAGLAAGVLAAAGIVGALYVQAGSGQAAAQQRLDAAHSQQGVLQAQTTKLAYVSAQKAQIDSARASLKAAMGSEVLWSKTFDQLRLRLPDGVRYTSVAVARVDAAVSASKTTTTTTTTTTGSSALPTDVIATATLSGNAVDLNAVAAELDQLAKVPGLSNVYLTTANAPSGSADASKTVQFTATANITTKVLSHRYDTLTGDSK